MDGQLKLSSVVKRGRLKLSTAQYVLKHPELLPGMPEAGVQGKHRLFSLQQAMRLATCTHLVMGGVPLTDAGSAVIECEKHVRRLMGILPKNDLLVSTPRSKHAWIVRVVDSQYCQVWRHGVRSRFYDEFSYWSFEARTWESMRNDSPFTKFELDVTALELQLRKGSG